MDGRTYFMVEKVFQGIAHMQGGRVLVDYFVVSRIAGQVYLRRHKHFDWGIHEAIN